MHGGITAARYDVAAIGGPGHAVHRTSGSEREMTPVDISMATIGVDMPVGERIPDLHRAITAGRGDACAAR